MLYKHSINCVVAFCNCVCFTSYLAALVSLCASEADVSVIYMWFDLLVYWFQRSIFECECYSICNTYIVYECFVAGSMYII